MIDLARYLELIVEPTVDEFARNPTSIRHAFLACVVTYHAIDRVTFPARPRNLVKDWRSRSSAFKLVEAVALHLKHVKSDDEKRDDLPPGTLRISHALGLDDVDDKMDLRNLYYVVRDAVKFIREENVSSCTA